VHPGAASTHWPRCSTGASARDASRRFFRQRPEARDGDVDLALPPVLGDPKSLLAEPRARIAATEAALAVERRRASAPVTPGPDLSRRRAAARGRRSPRAGARIERGHRAAQRGRRNRTVNRASVSARAQQSIPNGPGSVRSRHITCRPTAQRACRQTRATSKPALPVSIGEPCRKPRVHGRLIAMPAPTGSPAPRRSPPPTPTGFRDSRMFCW